MYWLMRIIVKPTLIGGQQNHQLQTERFRKADLMISCNFDFPVETDAKPSRKSSHKNHSHSYEKTICISILKTMVKILLY
jgi:hypothetical protein